MDPSKRVMVRELVAIVQETAAARLGIAQWDGRVENMGGCRAGFACWAPP